MSEVRLAIVGSRSLTVDEEIQAGVFIENALGRYSPDLVISGGAIGVDTLARIIAEELDIEVVEWLPVHPRWEPLGYKARNEEIAKACTHLLCVRSDSSTSYGSGWTADLAAELGKPVERVEVG